MMTTCDADTTYELYLTFYYKTEYSFNNLCESWVQKIIIPRRDVFRLLFRNVHFVCFLRFLTDVNFDSLIQEKKSWQNENFWLDLGLTQPVERKTAIFHFVFLLIISLLFIGILPGLVMLFFEKAEETTIKQRRKGFSPRILTNGTNKFIESIMQNLINQLNE